MTTIFEKRKYTTNKYKTQKRKKHKKKKKMKSRFQLETTKKLSIWLAQSISYCRCGGCNLFVEVCVSQYLVTNFCSWESVRRRFCSSDYLFVHIYASKYLFVGGSVHRRFCFLGYQFVEMSAVLPIRGRGGCTFGFWGAPIFPKKKHKKNTQSICIQTSIS